MIVTLIRGFGAGFARTTRSKLVDLPAVPQIGWLVHVGDKVMREVQGVAVGPEELEVALRVEPEENLVQAEADGWRP